MNPNVVTLSYEKFIRQTDNACLLKIDTKHGLRDVWFSKEEADFDLPNMKVAIDMDTAKSKNLIV